MGLEKVSSSFLFERTYFKTGSMGKRWFFSNSFFLYTVRKKFSWGTKYVYRGTFSFIFYFFSTCHGKVILELKQAMFNLATSFHMKSRKLSGRQKKMKQNKTKTLNGNITKFQRLGSTLVTFENTKAWKYSINSFCGQKDNNDSNNA